MATLTGITATADSVLSGSSADNAFNGVYADDYWASAISAFPHWLQAQVTSPFVATRYAITCRTAQSDQIPSAWTFLGSNDGGTTWTTLDTQSGQTFTPGQTKLYSFTNTTGFTLYRLNTTASPQGTIAVISELVISNVDAGSTAIYAAYVAAVQADAPWGLWTSELLTTAFGRTGPKASLPGYEWLGGSTCQTGVGLSTSNVTMEVWVYLGAIPSVATGVFQMWATGSTHDKDMWIDTAGKVNFYFYPGSPVTIVSSAALSLNTWHHVVASVGAAGAKLRIDKTTVATNASTSSFTGGQVVGFHNAGLSGDGGTSGVAGMILAAGALYTTQLTDVRTDAHYDAASGSYQSEVLADVPWGFWQQGELTGSTFADSSGNSNTMNISGAAASGLKDLSGSGNPMSFVGAYTLDQPSPIGVQGITWANGYGQSSWLVTSDVTFSAWVYLTSIPTAATDIIGMSANGPGGSTSDKNLWIDTVGKVHFHYFNGSALFIDAPTALSLGVWYHVVASVGAAGGKLRINKVTVGTNAGVTSYTGSQVVYIHSGGGGYDGRQTMTIAAPSVFMTQLTNARTDAHYDAAFAVIRAARRAIMVASRAAQRASRW